MIRRISMCALAAMLVAGCTQDKHEQKTERMEKLAPDQLVDSRAGGPANETTAPTEAHYGLFDYDDTSGESDFGPVARWPLHAGDRLGFTDSPTDVKAKPGRYAVAGTAEFMINPSHHYAWCKLHKSYRDTFPFP